MLIPPLVKIATPTAAVCQEYKPQPQALELLKPNLAPNQYVDSLQQNHLSDESIKFLAHGMPERESVWWATQSAQKVATPANAADQAAIQAANAWVKNPSEITRQQAAAAAAKTDFQTPGAWAAQAAAWSQPKVPTPVVPGAPAMPAVPRLTPHAVSGSVMLAAAMAAKPPPALPQLAVPKVSAPAPPSLAVPKVAAPAVAIPDLPKPLTPQERIDMAKAHEPFIKLGTDIASGQNTWG
jgi:hypothetical protein